MTRSSQAGSLCTRVPNLARTADRAAELSIRSAMGASLARLAQQLLTEGPKWVYAWLDTTPVQLRDLLLRQGFLMVAFGAIPGIAGAQPTGRFLGTVIDGATSIDLATYLGLLVFLAQAASTSSWAATRGIATLDNIAMLRTE